VGVLADYLGASPSIDELRDRVSQLLAHEQRSGRLPPILIEGETGTGKGLLARLIHQHGGRGGTGPFVAVNCAAIPESLLEAELFGFERGAFTDARQAKPGLFQTAHGGTLFLDEVGLLPLGTQAKLLAAVEERAIRRLGGIRSEPVDIRIMAATNTDLAHAVTVRRFREDLYHRLAVVTLTLPPLRDRPDDILPIAEHFLVRACADYALSPKTFSANARTALRAYAWPGNVRELSNAVERAALLVDRSVITAEILALPPGHATSVRLAASARPEADAISSKDSAASLDVELAQAERQRVLDALQDERWNITRAAQRLGIARHRLHYLIDKHRLTRPAAKSAARVPPVESPRPARPAPPPVADLRGEPRLPGAHESTGADAGGADASSARRAPRERRHLAFLRCDLLAMPEAAAVDRHWALSAVTEKLESFGGRVEGVGPWALVARFGGPPVENAPANAALAALAVQTSAARYRRLDPAIPEVRCVLHAADVMAESAGDRIDDGDKHAAYASLATLAALGPAQALLVSEGAARFLDRRFELVMERRQHQGSLVPVYRVARVEATGFGLGGRPLTRFVGRGPELGLLEHRLAQAERGRGQVISVVGDPGVGKSRLVYELARAGQIAGWRVLRGAAVASGMAKPSLPVVELLRQCLGVDDTSSSAEIRERLAASASPLRDQAHLPPLATLLDAADAEWQGLDPQSRRRRIVSAVVHLLLGESQVQPILVVIEDLHWSDSETQATLHALVESLPAARLVLVVTYRPGFEVTWPSRTYCSQLRLDVLDEGHASEMLNALMGQDPSLESVKRRLVAGTDGNPLFLEECVRTLAETGSLGGEPGAYRLAADLQGFQMPATVLTLLDARIRGLPDDARALLQRAAAIGKSVSVRLLGAITGLAVDELDRGLKRLQAAELLYEAPARAERGYTFKHALVQEAAHATLSAEERQDTHARLVEAIETLYADRLGEQTERLGHHAIQAGLWEKAVHYQRLAGVRAFTRAALREAAADLDLALLALGHLPATPDRQALGVDLRLDLRPALHALGEFDRTRVVLGEVDQLAEALGDQRRRARGRAELTELCCVLGPLEAGRDCGHDVVRVAELLGDSDLEILANMRLAQVCYLLGDFRPSIAYATKAIEALRKERPHGVDVGSAVAEVATRLHLTLASAELGHVGEGQVCAEEATRIAQGADDPYSRALAGLGAGMLASRRGDPAAAGPLFEEALGLCRIAELRHLSVFAELLLAQSYARSGVLGDAQRLCAEAMERLGRFRAVIGRSAALAILADVSSLSGRDDEALGHAREALDLARAHTERGREGWVLFTLAQVCSRRRPLDVEATASWYREALTLGSELSMRPLLAHAHLGLGTLCAGIGRRETAAEELASAAGLFRDMEMPFWVRRSEAALQVRAPR
jgi:DNA-binding NtrC family response regulator/tetratricopeptide (TPR) repeat protein